MTTETPTKALAESGHTPLRKSQKFLVSGELLHKQGNRTFISPNKTTVSAFLDDFVSLYGVKKWSPSTYEANTGLIRNYIAPLLGDTLMQDVTTIAADRFITTLQRTKCPVFKNRYSKTVYMTPANIERINI